MPAVSSARKLCVRKPVRHGTVALVVFLARTAPDADRARCRIGAAIGGRLVELGDELVEADDGDAELRHIRNGCRGTARDVEVLGVDLVAP